MTEETTLSVDEQTSVDATEPAPAQEPADSDEGNASAPVENTAGATTAPEGDYVEPDAPEESRAISLETVYADVKKIIADCRALDLDVYEVVQQAFKAL